MLFTAFRKRICMESEDEVRFSNIIIPMIGKEERLCDKIMFCKGTRNNIIIGLNYNRVEVKKVTLHDITDFGIKKFDELCYNTSTTTNLDSTLLDKVIVYNLCYIREILDNLAKEPTRGMDISNIFSKEYYDEESVITVDMFTKNMVRNFHVLYENDSEILLQLK